MQASPQQKNSNYINLLISLLLGILWAFFWAVDGALAYVLFGGAVFFLILFFFNQQLKKVSPNGQRYKSEKVFFQVLKERHKQTLFAHRIKRSHAPYSSA